MMTVFLATSPLPQLQRLHFSILFPTPTYLLKLNSHVPFSPKLKPSISAALSSNSSESAKGYNKSFYNQLQFNNFELGRSHNHNPLDDQDTTNATPSGDDEGRRKSEEEDLLRIQNADDAEKDEKFSAKLGFRKGKQIIRRSNLMAKQVISIRSALSLGFVSQLWVDTTSWMVLFVEVRPNLLSGDSEKILLEDINQVGDVVLVQDESVIDNEFKMIGLETLVGYKVVTPSQRSIGKVRGYTFSINSGAVEELELDSFGLSIIPSSLVSTYSLLVEDILEVLSDAVVVHEAAASRIQRLSKGFLGNQHVGTSVDDFEDYDSEESVTYGHVSRRKKSFGRKKPNRRDGDKDNWELPMDYL